MKDGKTLYLVQEDDYDGSYFGMHHITDLIIVRAINEEEAIVVADEFLDKGMIDSGHYRAIKITDEWRHEQLDIVEKRLHLLSTVNELN